MDTCIFCQQMRDGSLKERTIYEDDEFVAFIDSHSFVKGHTLLIPKKHVVWVWDCPDITAYFEKTTMLVNHLRQKLNVEKVDTLISGGSVPHAHIHILPNTSGVWFDIANYMREQRKKMTNEERKIDPELVEKLRMNE